MARPRPKPVVERDRSARAKRSNRRSASSAGRPGPWSSTSRRSAAVHAGPCADEDRGAAAVAAGVVDQVRHHLGQAVRVAPGVQPGRDVDRHAVSVDQLGDHERARLQRRAAVLQAREVQELVG